MNAIEYAIQHDEFFGLMNITVFDGENVIINDQMKVKTAGRKPTSAEIESAFLEANKRGKRHVRFYERNPDLL